MELTQLNKIAASAKIAPTAIIGENVVIGENTEISDYVIIRDNVRIGSNCKFHPHAVIGEDPQDFSYKGEQGFIEIGDYNIFREFTTVHKPVGEGAKTIVGNHNMLMAYSHIAHNCKLGNNIVLANNVQLAGHVVIEDRVNIGGNSSVHQNCRIGRYVMFSGQSATNKDIPPFFIYRGIPAVAHGINRVGLQRAQIDSETRSELSKAFKIIYKDKLGIPSIITRLETELKQYPEIQELIGFIKNSKRGIKRIYGD